MYKMTKYLLIVVLMAYTVGITAQSFTLDEAVRYAIDNSNQLKIDNLEVSRANSRINETKSIGMPKVNGAIDYTYFFQLPNQPVPDFVTPSVYSVLFAEGVLPERDLGEPSIFEAAFVQPHQLAPSITASGLLFSGEYIYALKGSRMYRELIRRQIDASEQEIRSQVTKAYLSVLIAERNKAIIADNIQTIEKSLAEVSAFYKEGFAEQLDVDRLQLSYDNLSTQMDNLNQVIALSKNLLKFQMGYPIDDELTLTESIEALEVKWGEEDVNLAGDIQYSNRAEYAVIEQGEVLNEINLRGNKAGYLPSATAFLSHRQTLYRANLFNNDEAGWIPTTTAGLGINVPIYDGGERKAKIQQIKLDMEKTALEKAEFERAMTLQVRNAQLSLITARKTLDQRKRALDMTQSIYERTQIKFREGVGSSVEVTQAEGQLFEAQGAYITALFELLNAKVDLDIAKGTL